MKKGLLLGAILLTAGAASAQNLYAGLQAGYGFGTPQDMLGQTTVVSSTGDQTTTAIYGSYGGGANIGLNVGYNFSEYFGAELGFGYFLGSSVTSTDYTAPTGSATLMAKSTQMRLSPSVYVSTGGDVALYGKAGLVLPLGGSTVAEYRDDTNPFVGMVEQDFETKGSLSLGFQGALGVRFDMASSLSLFGEIGTVNLRIKSGTRTTTRSTVDGTDILSMMDTYDKETSFVDELTPSSNNAAYNSDYSTAEAREELATTTNFSGLFINIGVRYNF